MADSTNGRRRTWSAFGDIKRVPSEYEIVSHDLNYTVRKGRNAALESNSSSPANLWYLTYRDKSPLTVDDWSGFRDPDELTYRRYVTRQDEQEQALRAVVSDHADAGLDAGLDPAWRSTLAALFTPTRYPAHAVQMAHAYLGQIAPSSYVSNCATFATADMLRRVSVVAYRTRELQLRFPDEGFGTAERRRWETDPDWQDTRKALELALIAYDWGECFTAVNLVLRPVLDDILVRQLSEVARDNGDTCTWLVLSRLQLDSERNRRWSTALARYAVDQRPRNAAVLERWIERWNPRAEAAANGLARLLQSLPSSGRPAAQTVGQALAVRDRVQESVHAVVPV